MASRRWDEGGDYTNEVVMHVAGVSKGCGTGRHDGRHQLVRLLKGWV